MPHRRKRLLIVEDHDELRLALCRLLEVSFVTECVATVAEAIEDIDGPDSPHVVLLDLMLPDASGVEVVRHIRDAGLPIRIVVVTALPDDGAAVQGVKALNPDAILFKPVPLTALIEATAGTPSS